MLGVFGGFNFQNSQGLILGGEADFNWTGLSGASGQVLELTSSGSCADTSGASTFICVDSVQSEINWYGTARATLGQSFGRLLLYGTAGLAYGEVKSTPTGRWKITTVVPDANLFDVQDSEVRFGWSAGLGGALALSDRISLRLEWVHVDLGERTIAAASGSVQPQPNDTNPFAIAVKDKVGIDTIRVGLTLHFM
jgi:outer membrane immunogenic protein